MATVPVPEPIESGPIGQEAATLRFQRLERVRARQRAHRHERFRARRRARRRHRLILLVIVLAGVGVVGFTAIRRTSFDRLVSPQGPAPVGMVKSPVAPPAATESALVPPSPIVPAATRVYDVTRDATRSPAIPAAADRLTRPLSDSQDGSAVASSRAERNIGTVDPTAVIDWLLKAPRREATSAVDTLLPDEDERR